MDKRIRLGFVYLWDEKWLGGVYYAQNLLKALNTLDEDRKPVVHIFCLNDKAFDNLKNETSYPFLEKTIVKTIFWKRVWRKIVRCFNNVKADNIDIFNLSSYDDIYFPCSSGPAIDKLINWIPDFQEKRLPEMFKIEDIRERDEIIRSCCKRVIPLVFSSFDAQSDFFHFYPDYREHPTFVLHFAASLPDYSEVENDIVKKKYGISNCYLFCANQFWKHKNHLYLFKAFKKALDKGLDMQLVCTGKMSDYRNPEYIEEIRNFIVSNHMEKNILLLGMIDRLELLCLMKNSYAVVQPSLFEGWNTTVEDCKAMSKFVFLSDLKVHQEQLDKNVCFFNPYDEDDLAGKLLSVKPYEEPYDYSKCIKEFGEGFYNIMLSRT